MSEVGGGGIYDKYFCDKLPFTQRDVFGTI